MQKKEPTVTNVPVSSYSPPGFSYKAEVCFVPCYGVNHSQLRVQGYWYKSRKKGFGPGCAYYWECRINGISV